MRSLFLNTEPGSRKRILAHMLREAARSLLTDCGFAEIGSFGTGFPSVRFWPKATTDTERATSYLPGSPAKAANYAQLFAGKLIWVGRHATDFDTSIAAGE